MTKLLRQEERTRDIVRGALEDAKRPPYGLGVRR
jgi:hypothetical protein